MARAQLETEITRGVLAAPERPFSRLRAPGGMGSWPVLVGTPLRGRSGMANGVCRSPRLSDVDRRGDAESILQCAAPLADCAIHLRVTKQELDRTMIACLAVGLCRLLAP